MIWGGLFIYLTLPLLVYGVDLLWGIGIQGLAILGALPQVLWWTLGVAIFTLWGSIVLRRLAGSKWELSRREPAPLYLPGRLGFIYQSLSHARAESYSQEKVTDILQSLTIDLISLRRDIPEEEARRRFRQGDWTEDPDLLSYFDQRSSFASKGPRRWYRGRKSPSPDFLKKTQGILDRLQSFNAVPDRRGKIDIPYPHN